MVGTRHTHSVCGKDGLQCRPGDLAVSVPWYIAVLDLRLWAEFVEDGELRGAGLIDRDARFAVALRDRRFCASKPDLNGFDVVAFTPSSRESLDELTVRCAALGTACSEIVDLGEGAILDIPDPDGTVLRFYHFTGRTDVFTGYSFAAARPIERYAEPLLRQPTP